MKKIFLILILILNLISCADDFNEEGNQSNDIVLGRPTDGINAELYNGILKFDTQEDFDQTISYIKHLGSEELKEVFSSFYDDGFLPLYFHSDDDGFGAYLLEERNNYLPSSLRQKDEFDKIDPLIFDDDFSSLLNIKRQIIVGNDVYMYTFHGILVGGFRQFEDAEDICDQENLNEILFPLPTQGSETDMGHGFMLVQAPNDQECFGDYGEPVFCSGEEDQFNTPPPPPLSEEQQLAQTFDNMVMNSNELEACSDRSSFVIFGKKRVCSKRFEDRPQRRTRIEYSNVNWLIYRDLKLITRHQRRRSIGFVSWWDTTSADEIGIVINNATFAINYSNYTPQPPTDNFPSNFQAQYFVDGIDETFSDWNPGGGGMIGALPSGTSINFEKFRPFSPFTEDVTIQVFSSNLPFNFNNINFTAEQMNNFFNDFIFDTAYNLYKSKYGTAEPSKFTIIFNEHARTVVQHVDLSTRRINRSKITKLLDSNWGGKLSFNINLDSSGNLIDPSGSENTNPDVPFPVSFNSPEKNLWDYDAINIDFIGYSRKDSNESYVRMNLINNE